ncbi:protein of unknown function [Nitrospira defluvii]|jgi:hypothetical protein|uniref:Uncharacterized protein n=1 Tax=Nitrospira defluvii TaxID=330214 RepID=D8P7M5_9BACT|nr:protein of unknown function [Nitrospira defluvii]
MTALPLLRQLQVVWFVVVAGSFLGCENYLVVTTATKFGLEISQVAKEPPKVVLGYKREETTIIPAEHRNATSDGTETQTDTYSVLAEFCVMANPSLWDFFESLSSTGRDVPDGLQIRSFFATGLAAAQAADSVKTRHYFRDNMLERTDNKRKEKRCF